MKKSILFLLMVLGGLLADFSASGQAPKITSPAVNNGGIANNIDPYNWSVVGQYNRTGVRRIRIAVFGASSDYTDINNAVYLTSRSVASPASGATYTFTISDLVLEDPFDSPYRVIVYTTTSTAANPTYDQSSYIFVNLVAPTPANPLIVTPTNNSTVTLCQDLTITVNGNYTGARRLSYKVYPTATPSAPIVDSNTDGTDVGFANASEAKTNYDLPAIPLASLTPNTPYTIEVSTFDPLDNQIGSTTSSTFTTGGTINNTPVITSPINGETNVSVDPTININAFTGCGTLTSADITIDKGSASSPADWAGSDSQSQILSGTGPFSWSPTTTLAFGTSYQVRVRFIVGGTPYVTIHTFTTVSVVATITSPLNNATNTPTCNLSVNVAAISPAPINGKEYRLQLRYKLASASNYSGLQTTFTPIDGDAANFGPYTVAIPVSGSLTPNTAYDIEAQYQVDLSGTNTWSSYGNPYTVRITTGLGTPNNPVITAPIANATNVSINPTVSVNAYPGCGTLTSTTFELDTVSSFNSSAKQTNTQPAGNGPFTWSPNTLAYGTTYYLRVKFIRGAIEEGSTTISFTTEPLVLATPLLVSPADESTLDLCSDVVVTVNANSISARSLVFKVFPIGPGPTVFEQTYNFADGTAATTPFTITLARTLFSDNTHYLVELTTRTGANNSGILVGQSYNDWFTGVNQSGTVANTPVITSPADGATINTVTPTIVIQSPFAGCTLNSVLYEILDGTVGNTVVASQSYTTATYNWTVPSFLTAGNTYRARVTYTTANGTFSDVNTFTITPTPGVSIQSPLSLTGLNPCGFPVIVNAYPGANTIKVEYRQKPAGSFGTAFYSTPSGSDYTFSFDNTQLLANTNYEIRLTAGNGTGGSFTAITGSATLFDFSTGGVGGTLEPTLSSPLDGATGVSVTPTITFAPYQGDCGTVTNYSIEIVPVGGSGDWSTRAGYYYATSTNPSFAIPNGILAAGTTYKIRIATAVSLNGANIGYFGNYDGTDSDPGIYTFTTVNPLETYLELVTSTSNVVGGETYLNSLNQTLQVLAVSGATQYEIQLSKDSTFTSTINYSATSSTNVFSFISYAGTLESGDKYYIRARVSAPSVGAWTSASNVKHVYNSLYPSGADSPVGNIGANTTKLRGWHVKNATSMFFQIATDAAFTNLVDAHGPYGPISTDPAGGGIAYERYSYKKWVGSTLTTVDASTINTNFQAYTILGEYDYVRYLKPGQTYYLRVKNARTTANGTYLQTGYWGWTQSFTVPAYTRTNTISMVGSLTNMSVKPTIYFTTSPANVFNVTSYQMQIATDAAFSNVVVDRIPATLPIVDLTPALNYNTTYYIRVRSQATNDPVGPTNWSAWSATTTFKTTTAPAGRVAAATTSLSGDEESQSVAYPNPFNSTVSVTLKAQYAAVTVSLVDQTGKVVDQTQATGGNTVVLGKRSSQGLYLIRIADQTGVKETIKVVKQY
ncbi:beta strand repeat-containing protein [Xanthocytophaga flava]|uniref:beta strand repeat-containing protein n=1 Tax=Xanthocytophaga flava TaxID=3048013 RepID=UPI0028D8B900|nr:T9SS type A sorting domain-containing protein [Xanthocytophaga flavus]MDJ1470534.1 T9SS type A sorting domain-containing protein [Xanthocytophaga flavus]